MDEQLLFSFTRERPEASPVPEGPSAPDGLDEWRAERLAQMEMLARQQGLPLRCRVRVELDDGSIHEGRLLLDELILPRRRDLHLGLCVAGHVFLAKDIVSCVRLKETEI